MIDCLILGDSIALGVSRQARECVSHTRSGISTSAFISTTIFHNRQANSVLISLGSNDGNHDSYQELRRLRSTIQSNDVVWLVSANNQRSADNTLRVAREFGDRVIHVSLYVGPDGVHPTGDGYRTIANRWRR